MSTMKPLAMLLLLATATGCESKRTASAQSEPKPTTPKQVGDDWTWFDVGDGVRIRTPGSLTKTEVPRVDDAEGRGFTSDFGNGGGAVVMVVWNSGTARYDIGLALDNSAKQMISGMTGTMQKFEKLTEHGRSARRFEFVATIDGKQLTGRGHSFAIGPRKLVTAMAFTAGGFETEMKLFVDSLESTERASP